MNKFTKTYDVTIIIPFFNSKNFLNKSLKNSIQLANKYKNIEILYIDDGSKDNSYNLLKNKILDKANIKLIKNKKNNGPGIARNTGLRKALGRKIIFLDIDDSINIKNFISMINKFKKSNHLILFNYRRYPININRFNSISSKDTYLRRLKKFLIKKVDLECIFTCFDRKFLIRNKIYFKSGIHEDVYFMFLLYVKYKKNIRKYNKIVYKKFNSKNSITSKFSERHLKGFVKALKDINKYLNKNKNLKKKIYNEFQYRLRGEYVNLHTRIYGSKVKTSLKKKYCSFLKENLTSFINKDYKPITKKDFILKTIM